MIYGARRSTDVRAVTMVRVHVLTRFRYVKILESRRWHCKRHCGHKSDLARACGARARVVHRLGVAVVATVAIMGRGARA